jgi:hypothetical protein
MGSPLQNRGFFWELAAKERKEPSAAAKVKNGQAGTIQLGRGQLVPAKPSHRVRVMET